MFIPKIFIGKRGPFDNAHIDESKANITVEAMTAFFLDILNFSMTNVDTTSNNDIEEVKAAKRSEKKKTMATMLPAGILENT